MLYCEECRELTGWPESTFKVLGPCEICCERRVCNDIPSRHLPTRQDKPHWWWLSENGGPWRQVTEAEYKEIASNVERASWLNIWEFDHKTSEGSIRGRGTQTMMTAGIPPSEK